jgi:PhnB protein
MSASPVPEGYHTVTPYLVVPEVEALIAFLEHVLGARAIEKIPGEDGKIRHGEVRIGDSVVMMGRASEPSQACKSMLYVYLADADATHARALAAGAKEVQAPADQFYGDRTAAFLDPAGNSWWIATRREQLSSEEITRRMNA